MTTPNVPLLKQTLAHIEANPDRWDQQAWRTEFAAPVCGTAYCFAGWAVILHGGQFAEDGLGIFTSQVVPPGADPKDEEQWRPIEGYATEILGIPCDEPDDYGHRGLPQLFEPSNELDDLRRIVADLCGEAS